MGSALVHQCVRARMCPVLEWLLGSYWDNNLGGYWDNEAVRDPVLLIIQRH